jgi:hypothetical protein
MLTLYKFRKSICTPKVFITLAEKQLPYQAIEATQRRALPSARRRQDTGRGVPRRVC